MSIKQRGQCLFPLDTTVRALPGVLLKSRSHPVTESLNTVFQDKRKAGVQVQDNHPPFNLA